LGIIQAREYVKIGLLIYGSLDTISGGYLYDRKLVECLRLRECRVEIISVPWRNYFRHVLDNFTPGLYRKLRSVKLDVLLEDELNHPSLFLLNSRLRNSVAYPIVSIVHHLRSDELRPVWRNTLYRIVEREYLSNVDGFIFNSNTTRSSVRELLGRNGSSVVAYPGCDSVTATLGKNDIVERANKAGPIRLLFVGNLEYRKNLHTLLDALNIIPRELWELRVIGNIDVDPVYVRRIVQQLKTLGLENKIFLEGSLTGSELIQAYEESHVLAVPSYYEGFGIVYLEGMGFGLPSIASTSGAAGELVSDGVNGFLVDPKDEKSIAGVVLELLQDRKKLADMGLAGLESFNRHPKWHDTGKLVFDFIEKLVARS
jgi:glycosyltransferase involved in cell wall biosynthesis